MGRPSDYSDTIATSICALLASGEPLTVICKAADFPSVSTVYRWLQANSTFRDMYVRAREDQADTLADQIVAIADEQAEVIKEDGSAFDPDVQRDRLRVEARKWVAAKLKPKKYGEKLELGSDPDRPVLFEKIVREVIKPRTPPDSEGRN